MIDRRLLTAGLAAASVVLAALTLLPQGGGRPGASGTAAGLLVARARRAVPA